MKKSGQWPAQTQGSWSLHSRYRSSQGFAVRAESASGFPVSYESCETDNKGENMVGKYGLKSSDNESNAKEFVASQIGGANIDGFYSGGHDGHGHDGNNGGGDSNNNNNNDRYGDSEHSNNKLINTVWWLILQCIRMLKTTTTMWGNGRPELVWLAMIENAFEFVAANLMMSAGMTSSMMGPSVLAVTEVMALLFSGFLCFLAELETSLCVLMYSILAGFAAVSAGLTWAIVSLCSNWDNFP